MADGLLSGVLPAAQSFGDYLKRNLLDLATNPRARLEQAVGQTQDTQRELGGLLAMAQAGDERAKQEFAQRMADTAANMSTMGMFIGPESALWRPKDAFKAQQMLRKNIDPEQVWKETGTGIGPDGLMRQEISDAPAKLQQGQSGLAGSVVSHEDLFKAYPELKYLYVEQNIDRPGVYGSLNDSGMQITKDAAKIEGQPRSTMLHEFQHKIQDIEDFGRGGSTSMVFDAQQDAWRQIDNINKELDKVGYTMTDGGLPKEVQDSARKRYNELLGERDALRPIVQMTPQEGYRTLTGEAESRLTQRRRDLTDEQRRMQYPFVHRQGYDYGYDVDPGLLWNIDKRGEVIKGDRLSEPSGLLGPQGEAMALAQKRAALPVSEGGLGLPANNTPEMRAKAMSGREAVHFSRHGGDYDVLDSGKYAIAPFDAIGTHVGSKQAAKERFMNTTATTDQIKGASYPVSVLGDRPMMNPEGLPWSEDALNAYLRELGGYNVENLRKTYPQLNQELRNKIFNEMGFTHIPYINDVEAKGLTSYIVPPENLRSQFAAFDPWRRNAAIATAMGLLAPDLLAKEEK